MRCERELLRRPLERGVTVGGHAAACAQRVLWGRALASAPTVQAWSLGSPTCACRALRACTIGLQGAGAVELWREQGLMPSLRQVARRRLHAVAAQQGAGARADRAWHVPAAAASHLLLIHVHEGKQHNNMRKNREKAVSWGLLQLLLQLIRGRGRQFWSLGSSRCNAGFTSWRRRGRAHNCGANQNKVNHEGAFGTRVQRWCSAGEEGGWLLAGPELPAAGSNHPPPWDRCRARRAASEATALAHEQRQRQYPSSLSMRSASALAVCTLL